MPGRVIDLGQPGVRLPNSLAVDTSLVAARFNVANRLPTLPSTPRARSFWQLLREQKVIGVLPPVVANEVFHIAIRDLFRDALPEHQTALGEALPMRRRFDWIDLYKGKPELLDGFLPAPEHLRRLIDAERMQFLQPSDLAPLPHGTSWEAELLRLIGHYRLDTSDAAILLDAQRAGITAIATLDADLRRARLDFDVYTWP